MKLEKETPPPSKRPRRSVTLPKPVEEKKSEEPKPKKPKATPKKEKPKPRKKSADNDKETRKISSESGESVIEEFVDADYLKGEYIAVRTEGSDFYLAEVLHDVLEKDDVESFKVQWFDVSGEDNVYVRSYADTVDARSVVCPEVKLKKESGGRFRLKQPMLEKIQRRIKRAGNALSSSDDDDDEADEDRVDKAKPLKLPGSDSKKTPLKTFGSAKKSKKFGPRTPVGKVSTGSPKPFLAPLQQKGLTMVTEPKRKSISSVKKYRESPTKGRGRPPIHDTEYRPNEPDSGEAPTPMEPEPEVPPTEEETAEEAELKPNPAISLVDSDPAFSAAGNPFNLPDEVAAIKCIVQRDFDAFGALAESGGAKLRGYRAVDQKQTVLHYALQSNDLDFLKMILSEVAAHAEPEPPKPNLIADLVAKNDSDAEAGNKALARATQWRIDWRDPDAARDLASYACAEGCTPDTLELLCDHYPKLQEHLGGVTFKELLLERVYMAVENGHTQTASHLVQQSHEMKNTTTQFSELQRQTLVSTMDRDTPYNMQVKVSEVRKKEMANMRITAVHTAASNQNGQFLRRLLEMLPENKQNGDERGRKPIHYAAGSYSSEPLQIILTSKKERENNFPSMHEVDRTGITPLMIAAKLGRENNCLVLLQASKKAKGLNTSGFVNQIDCTNKTAMHLAAENGHAGVVKLLAEWDGDVNKQLGNRGRRLTPLMMAAKAGHLATVKQLAEKGARLEQKDRLGRSALLHAALNGHYPVVAFLLHKGVNPNAADSSENSALHYAAAYGWYHVVQLLLQAGASPDTVNSERVSPLAAAVLAYHDETAQLLFRHGADPNLADNQKRTLLMLLVSQRPSEKVNERISYLVEHFSPSAAAQDIHGLTVLHHLAMTELPDSNQAELVPTAKLLLQGGADPNVKDYASRTALFHALKAANLPLAEFLLEKGAQCPESRATDAHGENLLHLIVRLWQRGDMADIVGKLTSPGLNGINDLATARSKAGFTPLLLAAKLMAETKSELKLGERGRHLLDVLISDAKSDTGATVSKVKGQPPAGREPGEEGRTAAHYLATSANRELLAGLLKHTPRLDVLDSLGLTPLTSALLAGRNQAVSDLLEAGALVHFSSSQPQKHQYNLAPLVFAAKHHSKERNLIPAIKSMLEKIEKVNEVLPCPTTAATSLMFTRDPAVIKLLLGKGADVSVKDNQGRTALHHAVVNSGDSPGTPVSQVVELLLGAGADPCEADNDQATCFHLAFPESRAEHDPMELLALLTQAGNKEALNKGDKEGNTALHRASRTGAMASVLHLQSMGAEIDLANGEGNTPLALAIKNKHQAVTVLLVQLGAELNAKVVYKAPEAKQENAGSENYWTSSGAKKQPGPIKRDAIEVVISHKWRNVMTLMLSRLLKRDEGMDSDYDMDCGPESKGFNFARCVQAACTVPDLETALVLVRRQKDSKELNELNDRQQTLLHVLALHARSNQPELREIAELLIRNGVDLDAQDNLGMTALHYAAYNKCDVLVQAILRAAGTKAEATVSVFDHHGRTPVTALFWNATLNDQAAVRILADLAGALGDLAGITLSTPVPLPPLTGGGDFNEPSEQFTVTPLMRAIYVNGARVIDKLLELGVDVNSQVEANGNASAMMLAVQRNNLTVVRRLLEADSPPANLAAQDDNCRTVLHHAARAATGWGYYENTEMLKVLLEAGALLSDDDVRGKSALDYALEGGNGKVAAFLQELLNVDPKTREKPKAINALLDDQLDLVKEVPDYASDAEAILEKINEDESAKKPPSPEVDGLSGMAEWGQIIEDLTTGLHGDVLLSEVEVKQSGEHVQNFTRMQIIGHKLKKQFVLFTRQGRCGQDGEWKITPFGIPENAIREFMRIYKAKTGNEWTALPEFRRCTKKHALVPFDLMNRIQAADLEFDLEVEEPSKLSPPMQELFNELTNVALLKEIVKQSIIDHSTKPFGRFVKKSLEEGLNTLFDIRDLIIAYNEAKNTIMDTNRMQWFLEQAMTLTFEFNKCVPNPGKRFDRILVLSDLKTIDAKIEATRQLLKLEFANRLLLAAQYRINDDNPTDYIYRSLNCSMLPLERTSEEAKTIVKFIENSGTQSTVLHIFKTCHSRDVDALATSEIDNHRLLWKPTSLCDVLYSLSHGVQVPCPQSDRKAKRYRKAQDKSDEEPKAIFWEMFADMKDQCTTFASEKKYAFLCQVALGKSKDVQEIPENKPDGDFNSLRLVGKDGFSSAESEIVSPEGASIPLGRRTVTNQTATEPSNKYIIYDGTKQMAIRYLVRFN